MSEPAKLLHIFPGFGAGGTQLRMASIINSLESLYRHHVVSLNRDLRASSALDGSIQVDFSDGPPRSGSLPYAFAFRRMVHTLQPAVVLTYNWGAIDAVLGARLADFCPIIHNECGFGPDEVAGLKRRRVWMRRLILNSIFRTVVTSETLLAIAQSQYKLRTGKVQLIRTGVDTIRYQPRHNQSGRAGLGIKDGTVLFGYVGGVRPEKNLGMLIRAFHAAQLLDSKLLLVGDGPCRTELEALAAGLKIEDRVIFAGDQMDPAPFLAMLDAFVMSSATEQVSNAQLEAMASGLPVICTDVGDSRKLLGEAAQDCVVPAGDEHAYAASLRRIASDMALRARLGAANRLRSITHFSKDRMNREYQALLDSATLKHRVMHPAVSGAIT